MACRGKFVAAQQMRTPLFFVEWVRSINERMPETLESVLKEIGQKSAAELAAADREPDAANYLREKLRVTVDPVADGNGWRSSRRRSAPREPRGFGSCAEC